MAIHKIEEFDLVEEGAKKVKTVVTSYEYTKRGEWWMGQLSVIIAENYCCRAAGNRTYNSQKRSVMFVGLEGDVDICAKIFEYAVDTARSCGAHYLKSLRGYKYYSSAEKNKVKNSYADGFVRCVKVAFDKQKSEHEAGWGLVMVVPKEVNDACSGFVADKYRSRHSVYSSVRNKGYEEGCKFNPNNKIGRRA